MTSTATRRSRASQEQLSQMVDFMYDNPGLTSNKFQKLYGKVERDKKWSELAASLNCLGGAVKTVEQWSTVWRDLKSRTSIKVRDKKAQKVFSGSNFISQEPITELEKRVIAVIGRDYIECSDSVGNNEATEEEKDVEDEEFIIEIPTLNETETFEIPRRGVKRLRVEDDDAQKNFLEIASKQADSLKVLAESNAASTEIAKTQADTLKVLAQCCAVNIDAQKKLAEALKMFGEAIRTSSQACNNLANSIDRIGDLPVFKKHRNQSEYEEDNATTNGWINVESNPSRSEGENDLNEPLHHSPIIVKSEAES